MTLNKLAELLAAHVGIIGDSEIREINVSTPTSYMTVKGPKEVNVSVTRDSNGKTILNIFTN